MDPAVESEKRAKKKKTGKNEPRKKAGGGAEDKRETITQRFCTTRRRAREEKKKKKIGGEKKKKKGQRQRHNYSPYQLRLPTPVPLPLLFLQHPFSPFYPSLLVRFPILSPLSFLPFSMQIGIIWSVGPNLKIQTPQDQCVSTGKNLTWTEVGPAVGRN